MSDSTEIKIKPSKIDDSVKKLDKLTKQINTRKVEMDFTVSKGLVVDNLIEISEQLYTIGSSLSYLIDRTRILLENTKKSFQEADKSSEDIIHNVGK